MLNHPDRLFPADAGTRAIARRLFEPVEKLPIVSPHGHTDPAWFALNEPFPDPARLLIVPDHYVLRMLHSQGVGLERLGIRPLDDKAFGAQLDGRTIWREFAAHYHLFRGTPTRLWLDHTFEFLFGITEVLNTANADHYYDTIAECLQREQCRPRALFESFNIEVIATTESPLDELKNHQIIRDSGWQGNVITAYRPDPVVDPDARGFNENLERLGELANERVDSWAGYLNAHRQRRAFFASMGATSTDHGHPSAQTADLSQVAASALYDKIRSGRAEAKDRELFRAQMLTEMAAMSVDDGLVMQIHPGSMRNHQPQVFERFGPDMGFDIPTATNYVSALKPLLDRFGTHPDFSLILFTLDETAYSRELAPLAGVYPSVTLGPAWWFFDAPDGMLRYRELVTETAGIYNTAGFNDDTRAFPSIPARHDMARRIDCAWLANMVATHRLSEDEAADMAVALAGDLARRAYRLPPVS
jgi:glucuronate isomerase